MKLKKLLIILALILSIIATSLLITSCDDEEEEGEAEGGKMIEALVLTADKTEIEKTGSVKLTVSYKPEDSVYVLYNGTEKRYLSRDNIRFYVEDSKGEVKSLNTEDGITATFIPEIGGTYRVYASYSTANQIYSNVIDIKVHGVRISKAEDLKLLSGSSDGFELTKDIDLGGASWSPIDFSGNLDGQGHTISNFRLDSNRHYLGFFGNLNGTVKNVQFKDVTLDVKSNKTYIGIVAGMCKGVVDACTVSGTVTTVAADYVGGIVGYVSGGNVKNCTNFASVQANKYVGGIAGYGSGSNIISCVNEGTVTGNENVGGVVGYMSGTVDASFNKATVEASSNRVGGVIGHAAAGNVNNCENQGEVSSQSDYVGGIIGYSEVECFGGESSGSVSGRYRVGGLFGYSSKPISTQENNATVTGRAYLGGIVGECGSTLSGCTNNGEIVAIGTIIEENTERSYVGGLAGRCHGISNGKNTVEIKADGTYVGGLAGVCNGDVSSSVNEGNVSGDNSTGGLVGYGYGTYTNCKNLGIINGKYYVGGIIGYVYSTTKLDGCINNSAVTGSDGDVGGLVGGAYNSIEIIACQNTADVTGKRWVGGFLGYASKTATIRGAVNNNVITAESHVGGIIGGGSNAALIDCENHGTVLATGALISNDEAYSYVGGLAGVCGSITNGKNTVSISGIAQYAGGLTGYCHGSITNSENNGDVTGGAYTGGLAGYVKNNITGSVNNGSVTGTHQTGGLAGNIYDGKIDNSKNYGKVTGKHNVGGIAGHVENKIEIIYTTNEADITGDGDVGGFVGFIGSTSSIRNAVNSSAVTGSTYVGGILGSGANTTLYDCENYGTVTATSVTTVDNLACTYVGGLAGKCYAVNNGKNTVDIMGNGAYVGGLAGYSGAVSYSQNDGKVKGTAYVGGLSGYASGSLAESKNYGSVEGTDYVGGLCGYINGQKIDKCENHASVKGNACVGGLCGYEYYKNAEISFCKNSGDVTGENKCGSLIGQIYNGTTVRYSENSGKTNGKHGAFVANYGGTLKGVIIVTVPSDLKISVSDTVTCELLGITAEEFDSKAKLDISITFVSGEAVGGGTLTYRAVVSDSYGNNDTFYFDIKVYGTPEISYDADSLSVKTNPIYKGSLVTFDLNGVEGNAPASQLVTDEITLKRPSAPTVDGYAFRGWYKEPECINLYDFSADLKGDITLYAGWEKMVTGGYYSRSYINVLNGYNGTDNTYSFSTANTSSSSCIYMYFTAFTSGTYTIRYRTSSNGTYWYVYNETKDKEIKSNFHSSSSTFESITFTADAGDVIYIRSYRNYSATCYVYFECPKAPSDGGRDVIYGGTAKEILGIDARDSFGGELEVEVALKSGEFVPGQTVVYTITATDVVGNIYSIDTEPILITE